MKFIKKNKDIYIFIFKSEKSKIITEKTFFFKLNFEKQENYFFFFACFCQFFLLKILIEQKTNISLLLKIGTTKNWMIFFSK